MSPGDNQRGRSITVTNAEILHATESMLSEIAHDDFSVRELAKVLGVVPGTIYARFGTKDELLARLHVQLMDDVIARLNDLARDPDVSVATVVSAVWPQLGDLQRRFTISFDEHLHDSSVQPETWRHMRAQFRRMSHRLYSVVQMAAKNEGVTLAGGTLRERLLWTMLASINRTLTGSTLGHQNESYERFIATALVAALRSDVPDSDGGDA